MGWLFPLLFAALVWAGLYACGRCSRTALELSAAVLLLGVVGYGWQGSPTMPGNPVSYIAP